MNPPADWSAPLQPSAAGRDLPGAGERAGSWLQAIFDHALNAVLLADDAGRYVDANPAACVLLGYSREDLLRLRVHDVVVETPHTATGAQRWQAFQAAGVERGEVELRRGDGTTVVAEYSAVARVLPGLHLSILTDVTVERQARHERDLALAEWRQTADNLALALSVAKLGVMVEDLATDTLTADENLCRLLDRDPTDPHLTLHEMLARIHPDDRQAYLDQRRQAQSLDHGPATEFRVVDGTGAVRHLRIQRAMASRTPGSAARVIGVVHEVTEARRLEHEQAARLRAEAAARARSEFLSRMSHELRTPLNAILGFCELLQFSDRHPLAAEQREQVGHVHRAGEHLLALVDDLLDIARHDAGRLALREEPVDVSALVMQVVSEQQPSAHRHGVTVTVVGALTGTPRARGDRQRVRQVIANLISNAIDHNRPGGAAQVEVEDADGQVSVSVRDDGPGMTPEEVQASLLPFERVSSNPPRPRRTGLGLAVTRSLLEAMGGRLDVTTAPGAGSTFRAVLPAASSGDRA